MRQLRSLPTLLTLLLACAAPAGAHGLTDISPNMQNPQTTPVGTLDFVLMHRFDMGSAGDEFEASPTFVLATGLSDRLEASLNGVTASAIGSGFLVEPMLKYALLPAHSPVQLDAMLAYNSGAISGDGALMGVYDLGPLSLRAIAKGFTSTFGVGGKGAALGAGAVWHINANWGLSADYNQVVYSQFPDAITQQQALMPAWSVGANFKIPYSPHSLIFYATNANSYTLEGTSRGVGFVRYGFDFDIPFNSLDPFAAIFNPQD